MMDVLKRIWGLLSPLYNTRAAGAYLILIALAVGVATFIENDFGTSTAQKVIFQTWWFELILFLFGVSIIANVFKFRMIPQKKWALLTFHVAIIIILIGAAITRYAGFEGMMHIRENDASNTFLSSNTFLKFHATKGEEHYDFDEPVLFASLGNNHWHESYLLGDDRIDVEVKQFIPNPQPVVYESLEGRPMIKLVAAGANGREEYFISQGESRRIGNLLFNFEKDPIQGAINLAYQNDSLWFTPHTVLSQTVMATQQRDTLYPNQRFQPLTLRALYNDGTNNFVFPEFHKSGKVVIESASPKVKNESLTALVMNVEVNGEKNEVLIYGQKGVEGQPRSLHVGDLHLSVSYGSKELSLPFSIKLYDFIMEKYPGTNNASSYASEVQLIDSRNNLKEDYRIYMNNILNYEGYRFFQSSFDRDEKGTYLSVNHDFWGSIISYIGYGLLTLGMLMTFFSKKTRFHQVSERLKKLREKPVAGIIILLFSVSLAQAQSGSQEIKHPVDKDHAKDFSEVVVQDFNGRMKPVHTLSREVMRKIARKESMFGLSADQILLSMFINPQEWYDIPVIKLGKHPEIQSRIGVSGSYAAYSDFFDKEGSYKFQSDIRRVHSLAPIDRGTFEKELLKLDERVNILNMVFSGSLLKVIPNPSDPNNTWLSTSSHHNHNHEHTDENHYETVAERFFSSYRTSLQEAAQTGNYQHVGHILGELKDFQQQDGGEVMPSPVKIKSEIMLNNSDIFSRLTGMYILLGLAFLISLFISIFNPKLNLDKVHLVLLGLVLLGFGLHTLGLGIRWYVSGRAPWSNGYESMIYIARQQRWPGLFSPENLLAD
ncbi:MAG: cytochrome c biogenesis protein ResB [Bacteroidia bacterium]